MPKEVYAFKNNRDILLKSSSGGAFWAVLEACYRKSNNEVTVYGAMFDDKFRVVHNAAYTLEECAPFRGSKYVRSDTRNSYIEIEDELVQGKTVLFSGTPCQVAALKTRLSNKGIDTKKLYVVDVICHGTPRAEYWESYKTWIEKKYGSEFSEVSFRDKSNPGAKYSMRIAMKNGRVLVNKLETALFTRLFLRRLIMEEGCYKCPFANLHRHGDITLGDFWGIEKVMPDFPEKDGVSLVLVNTDKGSALIDEVKRAAEEDNKIIKQCFSDGYIEYQNNLQKAAERPGNTDIFKAEYKQKGFDYIVKKYAGYSFVGRMKHKVKKLLNK